ncbi:NUDIX hydrolase [Ensifer sp. ENS11]|uniref:NUDIX hydrolase n=1 Tax=Ensifer sp. ENS11 TaxID=2769291 RepID=UPI00177E45CF|nr:NUDIX domain-containing protein [Ensifer sp. ENS11]MBD9490502.1 NUDIX domain-containing protein [Ensifer sp. ENS11]MDP9633038.1 ADP-ribose pyrophosphatase YjhB (NUDIX family) [Ensifer adhaerens]
MTSILSFVEPADAADVAAKCAQLDLDAGSIRFAVEGLVFNGARQAVLIERGLMCRDNIGLLEGIGGECRAGEGFRDALRREIEEEVGAAAIIDIERFSHVRLQDERERGTEKVTQWAVASYVCRWISGPLMITEPTKNSGFHFVDPHAFGAVELAPSARFSLNIYRASAA